MTDVIRRKIDRARQPQAEGAPGADRGWRLALARAARDAMGLDLDFRSLTISRLSLAEILELVPDRALLALLDGPQGGLGVIMLGPTVTATFIEKQTLGRLSAQPPAPRKASRIDAAMVAGVIDRALAGLDETLAEEADLSWAGGFRYASYLDDPRPLGLMLEEEAYRVLSAEVALGGAGREGRVILVLPALGRGEMPATPLGEAEPEAPQFSAAVSAQVLQAESRLDAVIGRLTLPLRQIMSLQVGETLVLPQAALDAISLETVDGRHVAKARLGQYRSMRAVKLGEAVVARPVPAPVRPVAQVVPDADPPELRAAG
ncbi:MAG: FliM/FliN family flagellar motor switch protein [Tabrizicola sp.]